MLSNSPLISIITSFFNEEKFIRQTIESVLSQQYGNWELLLVDDGSNDASRQIAKEFAAKHPGKIIYLHHPGYENKGVSSSRNLALNSARGDLIALLDADDVWLQEKLIRQVAIFQQYPEAGMVCEASKYWHSWDPNAFKSDIILQVGAEQDRLHEPPHLVKRLYPLGIGAAPCPSGVLVKKEVIRKIGGFHHGFTEEKQFYEDQAFLVLIYLNEKVFVSSEYNNLYRQRRGSLVDKQRHKYRDVRKYFLQWLQEHLKQKNISDPEIHKLMRKAMLPYRYSVLYSLLLMLPYSFRRFLKKIMYR